MDVSHATTNRLKSLLLAVQTDTDLNTIEPLKECLKTVCAKFLGGIWMTASLDLFRVKKIMRTECKTLLLCQLADHSRPVNDEPMQVLVRVFLKSESHLVTETLLFSFLSDRGLGPKLFGVFTDGRLEQYLPSRELNNGELTTKRIGIAKLCARIHNLKVPFWHDRERPPYVCDMLDRWIDELDPSFDAKSLPEATKAPAWAAQNVTTRDLKTEIKYLRKQINKSTSPVVFCHNDLSICNILKLEDAPTTNGFTPPPERLELIDFEFSCYNYRAFEFGNYFFKWVISFDFSVPETKWGIDRQKLPTREEMLEFAISYLTALDTEYSEKELLEEAETIVQEAVPFIAVGFFFEAIWAFNSVKDSTYRDNYGQDFLRHYLEVRHMLDAFDGTYEYKHGV